MHFQQCRQKRQRRFRALVLIGAVRMQAVAAAAGDGIIERKLQIVVAEEPVEGRPGFVAPAAVSSNAVCLQARRNRTGSFKRLLIEAGLLATLAIETLRSNRYKVAVDFATLRL